MTDSKWHDTCTWLPEALYPTGLEFRDHDFGFSVEETELGEHLGFMIDNMRLEFGIKSVVGLGLRM